VDTNTDLGTGEHTIPALQHWNAHRLFHRPLFWVDAREAKVIGFNRTRRCVVVPLQSKCPKSVITAYPGIHCKRRKNRWLTKAFPG
jgi:hypothetical protein